MRCNQCPRKCNAERKQGKTGICSVEADFLVARAAKHRWEEPIISGQNGSGAIFFGGCNLHCIFCQNKAISHGGVGKYQTKEQLTQTILSLQEMGAHNINLVTPTHYTLQLVDVLKAVKPKLHIPIVWNSSAYESPTTLRHLNGLVDIYLPDCKYYSSEVSCSYSSAPDYFTVAIEAIAEMLLQVGEPLIDSTNGLMQSGVIVRHLVLPSHRKDSIALLHALKERFGTNAFLLSLMGQYTPDFAADTPYKNLHRRLTSFEYQSVLDTAVMLGFQGFSQDLSSASASYTPSF